MVRLEIPMLPRSELNPNARVSPFKRAGQVEIAIDRRQSPKTIIDLEEVGDGEGSTPED